MADYPNYPTCQSCDARADVLAGVAGTNGPEWVPVCDGHFESPALWWADHDPDLDGPIVPSYALVRIY